MGVYTFNVIDKTTTVAPSRVFKATCIDNHNSFPKIMPHYFKSVEFVEGDSTVVGSIKKFYFAEEVPYKYFTSKFLEIDEEKCYVKYITFEGDALGDKLESIVYEASIDPKGHYKIVGHFHSKGDIVLTEEEVKDSLYGMVKSVEAVEQYLTDNPEVYA